MHPPNVAVERLLYGTGLGLMLGAGFGLQSGRTWGGQFPALELLPRGRSGMLWTRMDAWKRHRAPGAMVLP